MAKYVISDTHLKHKKLIEEFHYRPFVSIEAHDDYILNEMLKVLREGHRLYHLGDVCFYDDVSILDALKPYRDQLYLALGNHDSPAKLEKYQQIFKKIAMCYELGDLVMCHFPIHESQLLRWTGGCIHGHVHMDSIDHPKYFNASVENIGYAPVALSQIKQILGA